MFPQYVSVNIHDMLGHCCPVFRLSLMLFLVYSNIQFCGLCHSSQTQDGFLASTTAEC